MIKLELLYSRTFFEGYKNRLIVKYSLNSTVNYYEIFTNDTNKENISFVLKENTKNGLIFKEIIYFVEKERDDIFGNILKEKEIKKNLI